MNIPLPDSGIPVQPGDDHFKYKGVYHPITWINDMPYRPRVETLVIMGGNMVYVRLKDGDKLGSSGNGESYELPGGSMDADSSPIKQAENEINEEALISVKNIYDTGIQYYADYPSGFLMNGGDTPLEYAGHISSVFVAEYNGIHDRNSVEKKDLDPKISENGKFYLITQVVPYLRQEHIDALLNSPYVKDSVKGAIRIINRKSNPLKKNNELLSSDHVVGELFFASKNANMLTEVGSKYKNNSLAIDTGNTTIIRVFNSIDEALTGYDSTFGRLKNGDTIYVYTIADKIDSVYTPTNQESPSSKITGELWIKPKRLINVKRLGLVRVLSCGAEDKYYYGKNSTLVGKIQRLKHEWVTKDVNSTGCMESSVLLPRDKKLYHGSTFLIEEFKPMSLDLGNAQQEPGWSTFTFTGYTLALRFGLMRSIQKVMEYYKDKHPHLTCSWDMKEGKPWLTAKDFKVLEPLITNFKFYVYTIDASNLDVGLGNDHRFPEFTFRESGVIPEKTDRICINAALLRDNLHILPAGEDVCKFINEQERIANGNRVRGWYGVMMTKDYSNGLASAQLQKAVKDGKLKPGDGIAVYMSENGIAFDDDSISMRSYTSVTESLLISKGVIDVNFEDFESGKSNVVLITGLSGSGKSTLGRKIADKYNAEYIELDMFEYYLFDNDEHLKTAGNGLFYQYFLNHKDAQATLSNRSVQWEDRIVETYKFIPFAISWCKQDSKHKYVIEGIQIYQLLNKEKINGVPILFTGTSGLKSLVRSSKRDYADFNDRIRKLPQNIRWYIDENKAYEKFKKSVLESAEYSSLNSSISFSESFEDVRNVVNSLTSKELHLICNGTFKNSPYVIYRKCILINNDAVAFIDIYKLPSMSEYTGAIVLACKKKYRNKGYTSILINDAIEWAKKSNIVSLIWPVDGSNTKSKNLAKKFGFLCPEENTYSNCRMEYTLEIDNISMREYSSVTESLRLPGKLYHGSTCKFDELRPTGIDFGNTFQEPGWSLFTWTKIDSAIGWAIFCVIKKLDISHYGCMNSQTTILPESSYDKLNENINKLSTSDKTFYVYTIKPESDFEFGLGHSSNTPNCITIRRDHIKPIDTTKYILTMELVDKYCKVVPDDYKPTLKEQVVNKRLLSVFMKYDFMYQPKLRKQLSKDVKSGKLSVGDDLREYLINNNFDLKEVSIIDRLLSRDAATDTTLEKIKKFHFELSSFDYFIVQEDGTIDYTTSRYMEHRTLTPSQFEKYKGGICWDYVPYQVDYFKKHFKSVKTKSFFHVFINDKDQPTHTFMLFYLNHKVYYFECSWKPMMGIYEFSSEADALSYIVSELYKGLSPDQRDCVYDKYTLEYNPLDTSLFGLNCVDYMNYMGNKIDKNQGICKYIENKLVRPAVIQKTTVRVENNKPIVSVTEACKNINDARKFVSEVGKLAKKYDANYFIVTDGASGISNKGNLAVRHARNCQIEWEKERGFDPYEDWSKSKITEAAEYSSVNKYPVFIALMHTGTNMSKTVRTVTHDEFTHATIAFNSKLNPLYSFGTKNFPGNDHGFVIQEPTSDFYRHYKSKYSVFVMYVSKEQRDKMLNRLQYFIDNADSFKFDIAALVACALKIPIEFRKKFFCSRFCMEIIGQGIELEKVPSLWSPQQMSELNNISLVNKGDDFYKYDYRITERNLKKIKSGHLDDIVLESNLTQGDDVYYRVTFNGVGIYEAYKSMVSEDTWRRFKSSSACSWLPAPMSYGFGYKSYFTKQGIDNFKTFTLLKIAKTIPLNMIKIEEVVIRKSRNIVYQDTFQIIVYEPTKLKESTLLEAETPRSELPDNEFGLPSERKYPLDSVSHVNSAIKFFNYVSKDDEEELANNIIKKINEYDMTGKLSVTTKNRIYPYLTSAGLMESLSETDDVILNDYIMNLPTNLRRRTIDKLSEYRKENRLYENKMYVEGRLVSIVMVYQDPVDVTTAHAIIMCIDGTNQSTIKDLTDDIVLGVINLYPHIDTLRLLDVVSGNDTTVVTSEVKDNLSSITESWVPLMENNEYYKNIPLKTYNKIKKIHNSLSNDEKYYVGRTSVSKYTVYVDVRNEAYIILDDYDGKYTDKHPYQGKIISIAASSRSRGTGDTDRLIKDAIRNNRDSVLIAEIDKGNYYSENLFKRNGFRLIDSKDDMLFYEYSNNNRKVMESWIPLMEASDDDEAATDYTAEADTDDATDYTEEADTSDSEDSGDSQEETASDYTEDANTDESEEDTTDNGSENENSDTSGEDPLNGGEDLSATDYTDEAGSSDNADGGDSSDTSSTSEIPRNGNLIDNNVLKNYSVLTNFEKLYNLTKEVSDSMDSVVMPTKLQNTVLAQALKNLNSIKEFILSYVKFQFSSDNYAQNLYYYNIVLQTLNLNLEILKRNKDLGETKNDSKKSRR